MNGQSLKDYLTDAIRYWEPRRLVYNAVLAVILLTYFGVYYPGSRKTLSLESALLIFLLAVLANVAYCAAYLCDIFAQASGYRERWRAVRWIVFVVGLIFAGILTRYFAIGFFHSWRD